MSIQELIKKQRPNIAQSSVKTYTSIINNLAKQLDIKLESADDIKKHIDKIIAHLKDAPVSRRKTTMSALIVCCDNGKDDAVVDRMRGMMYKDIRAYNDEQKHQEMDEKTKDNWLSMAEVDKTRNKLEKQSNDLWKIEDLGKKDFLALQDYVLVSLLTMIPPMRSTDISFLKLKDIDKKTDNYKDKDTLVINKYKTAKTYGQRKIKIPAKLNRILNAWAKKNDSEWMFVDSTLTNQLTPTKLMNRLYNIFNKKVSTSMLRKIFVTERLMKDVPALEKLEEVAQDMGHSVMTAMTSYKKKK